MRDWGGVGCREGGSGGGVGNCRGREDWKSEGTWRTCGSRGAKANASVAAEGHFAGRFRENENRPRGRRPVLGRVKRGELRYHWNVPYRVDYILSRIFCKKIFACSLCVKMPAKQRFAGTMTTGGRRPAAAADRDRGRKRRKARLPRRRRRPCRLRRTGKASARRRRTSEKRATGGFMSNKSLPNLTRKPASWSRAVLGSSAAIRASSCWSGGTVWS